MYLPDGIHRPSGFFLSFPTQPPVFIFAPKQRTMAQFITSFQQLMITAALPEEVLGYIQDPSAVMTLYCNQKDVFTSTIYQYNGYVRLYDIRSLIEEYIRESGDKPYCDCYFKLIAGQSTIISDRFTVIYSEFNFPNAASFFANHFATTRKSFRIYREGQQYVWWYKDTGIIDDAWYTDCIIQPTDGSAPKVVRIDEGSNKNGGYRYLWVKPKDIQKIIDENDQLDKGKLLSFTIHRGGRSMTFYVTDEQPDLTISFYDGFYNLAIAEQAAFHPRQPRQPAHTRLRPAETRQRS